MKEFKQELSAELLSLSHERIAKSKTNNFDHTQSPDWGETTSIPHIIYDSRLVVPRLEATSILDEAIKEPERTHLGEIVDRWDIESSLRPFHTLPEYRTEYPHAVINALGELFQEYNQAFVPLVEANQEWETDYQYTRYGINGDPINRWVQIDMIGLPQRFLDAASRMDHSTVREVLRQRIFEIENSLAMYQLLERIHSRDGEPSLFDRVFRSSLQSLREQYGKPIALLALTDQKYNSMKSSEFGKSEEEQITDEEVKRLSGFDRLFGPQEFLEHLEENGGECRYILFVRASDPVEKLKKPKTTFRIPLLENPVTRKVIKANAITFNIDRPDEPIMSMTRINDTKAYLPLMGMAYRADTFEDVFEEIIYRDNDPALIKLNPQLREYLRSHGIDQQKLDSGYVCFRAKPMVGSYGCYGHVTVDTIDGDTRSELRKGLRERGPYVIQPEMTTPIIVNESTGQTYTYIDRVFFATDGRTVTFMGGFRSLMPLDSVEAQKKRNHGNHSTVWAEIY